MTTPERCAERLGVCPRCEQLPAPTADDATLLLWPPLGHSAGKLRRRLAQQGAQSSALPGDGMRITPPAGGLEALADGLCEALTSEEIDGVRALSLPPGQEPGLADYPRVTTLRRLRSSLKSRQLLETLRNGPIEIHYLPIGHADAPEDIAAYRAEVRLPHLDMPLQEAMQLAEEADLLFQFDRACRVASIVNTRKLDIAHPVFVEFQPAAIYDPAFCLRTTVAAVEQAELSPDSVIFSLSRPNRRYDVKHLQSILSYYRAQGFRVALGNLGSGLGSVDLLQHLKPEYAWLSRELITDVHTDPYRAVIARKLLEIAHRLRIETVAESGFGPEETAWLYEHGASFIAAPPGSNLGGFSATVDPSSLPAAHPGAVATGDLPSERGWAGATGGGRA